MKLPATLANITQQCRNAFNGAASYFTQLRKSAAPAFNRFSEKAGKVMDWIAFGKAEARNEDWGREIKISLGGYEGPEGPKISWAKTRAEAQQEQKADQPSANDAPVKDAPTQDEQAAVKTAPVAKPAA